MHPATTSEAPVRFYSAGQQVVELEGLLGSFGDAVQRPAVVLCHPGIEGQVGMEYPVIAACARSLQGAGFVTLRFNFRGVQGSGGPRTAGLHEVGDVLGALALVFKHSDVDGSRVYLVGNSFGAWMVLEAVRQTQRVAGMACIVAPLNLMPGEPRHLRHDPRPKLFVVAERDQFCDLDLFRAAYGNWAEPKDMIVLSGSDHFLGIGPSSDSVDRSSTIAEAVASWFGRVADKGVRARSTERLAGHATSGHHCHPKEEP